MLNITAADTTASGGYLTAWPTGVNQPNTSIINFGQNDIIPNLVQVGVGTNGDVSLYNFNGSTDVIVDIEGYTAPSIGSGTLGEFIPLNPTRICDTRPANGSGVVSNQCNNGSLGNSGALSAGETISLNVSGSSGAGGSIDSIPSGATAVVLNVTATGTTAAGGFLTVYPSNLGTVPNASNLNFSANESIANRVIVPIDPSTGNVSIYNFNGSTNIIVDVNGYYTGNSSTTSGYIFNPIAPMRICDTRAANGPGVVSNQCDNGSLGNSGPLSAGEIVSVAVSNNGVIPSGAVSMILNITATNTSSNGGFFTVYPTPSGPANPPNVSDLNWSSGETIANMSVVKVGNSYSDNVYNAIGSTDLIIDAMGYYSA